MGDGDCGVGSLKNSNENETTNDADTFGNDTTMKVGTYSDSNDTDDENANGDSNTNNMDIEIKCEFENGKKGTMEFGQHAMTAPINNPDGGKLGHGNEDAAAMLTCHPHQNEKWHWSNN